MLIRRLKSSRTKTGLGRAIVIKNDQYLIFLDPQALRKDALNLISHAHADHLPTRAEEGAVAYGSEITAAIGALRTKKTIEFRAIDQDLSNIEVSDAGHTVGSSQYLIRAKEASVLYTGDFCPRKRFFLEGARPQNCETLIIESTYGSPSYVFPPIKSVLMRAKDWIEDCFSHSQIPVLIGYSFGKAQLLGAFLEQLSINYAVHPAIFQINSNLKRFSLNFKGISLKDSTAKRLFLSEDAAIISPRKLPKQYFSADRVMKNRQNGRHPLYSHAHFTGWAIKRPFSRKDSVSFPLSDHADFNDLLHYIEGCNPERVNVFLYPGSRMARNFANHVKNRTGIDAISLEEPSRPQRKLADYLDR
ncbi:MAG: MBL fold metallo-hydrolase RNA specificity domain-containing protein [Candidatus Hodarchaeota archaeon]